MVRLELELDPRHVSFWEGLLYQAVGILLSVRLAER
jgi:hypothetical protein